MHEGGYKADVDFLVRKMSEWKQENCLCKEEKELCKPQKHAFIPQVRKEDNRPIREKEKSVLIHVSQRETP